MEFSPIFYMVSFVGAKELSRNLLQTETNGVNVVMSQVVPPPIRRDGTVAESAVEFVRLLDEHYPGEEPNFVGFEGYINAKVVDILRVVRPALVTTSSGMGGT